MYSTCLFCHAQLGANEVVEHFPVGRRLAFASCYLLVEGRRVARASTALNVAAQA